MKTLPAEAVEMLEGRRPIIAGAIKAVFEPGNEDKTYRIWSGYGDLAVAGEADPFRGVGARALITPISTSVGGAADGLRVTLSELDPEIAQTVEAEEYHQKPVTVWRLFFAADRRTLLAAKVFLRGRIDTVTHRESVGGEAALDFAIEGPRRDMSRAGARIRADADQRTLGGALDAAFKHISIAGRKTLRWGERDSSFAGITSGLRDVTTDPRLTNLFGGG